MYAGVVSRCDNAKNNNRDRYALPNVCHDRTYNYRCDYRS